MPIYEYACRRCAHEFEELVLGSETPVCPECRAEDLEKRFSVFAVADEAAHAPARSFAPAPCGTCGDPRGPGSCATDRP